MQPKEVITAEPIGTERELDVFEMGDLLASGLSRENAADLTPEALTELADYAVRDSNLFVGA